MRKEKDYIETKIKLKANNSSGKQTLRLSIQKQDDREYGKEFGVDYSFTLWGKYRDDDIQIDFDGISKKQFKKFVKKCQKVLDAKFK